MPPVDTSPKGNMCGFEQICSLKCNDTIPFHMYRSVNTGITICIAEIDGPIIDGCFNLATEAFDDDGLPHTLEHLVFMGSEEYPYEGILNLWANRCLASGTNAATCRDKTYYTMSTAGSEGFLSLMPIFLEHILYPTLHDSAFLTEVHHITGEGEDAGVVYCEMQGKENTGENMVYNEILRAAYPGKCGYKAITGGALKNLRESTNNEKVKQYHEKFYRPENLTILIMGQIKHIEVFQALMPLEQKILLKGKKGTFQRPWQTPIEPLTKSVDLDVCYPCDDEDNGMVNVAWRGPSAVNQVYDLLGCSLLLSYLTNTPASPLKKEFVERSDPCASNVYWDLSEYSVSLFEVVFENVPVGKIHLIKGSLMKVLSDLCCADSGINMKRMKTIIHRYILGTLSCLETSPHLLIENMVFGHTLYGNTNDDLDQRLNNLRDLKKLENEPEVYWLNLLKNYFVNAPIVVANGIPSIDKQRTLAQEEKERIAEQIAKLGPSGLEHKDTELQQAIKENEKHVPDELLANVSIPSTDSINFHHIKSYTTETEQHPKLDVTKLPFFTYLDHINTNFVYLYVIMDTSSISREYRKYVPLLLEAITESPVKRGDQLIPYEDVVALLEADTSAICTQIGVTGAGRFSCGEYSHSVNLSLQVELEKYEKSVQWIAELLYNTELTAERLKVIAAKMVNDVAGLKRYGEKIAFDLMTGLLYKKDSNPFTSSILRQQKFLNDVMERLNTDAGQKEVIAEIESVRKTLTSPKNIVLYMATNVDKLTMQVPDVYAPWNIFFSDLAEKTKLNVTADWTLINSADSVTIGGCVTGLGSTDSSYLCQTCSCISDYQNSDLPALYVCLEYFAQAEGPMWRLIRGQGLSYGYNLVSTPNDGLLRLTLYKATNAVAAYKKAKSIVETHVVGDKWDKLLFESAKSSLIFSIISRERTVGSIKLASLESYFRNVPRDYNRQIVRRLSTVTMDDMTRVAALYVKPLFDPKKCKTTITCHPSKVAEIGEAFKGMNHDLKLYNCLEETYLSEW